MADKPGGKDARNAHGRGGAAKGPAAGRASFAGKERRRSKVDPAETGKVQFDDRGNAVWEWADMPRRRAEDDTLDLLKVLEPDGLSLAEDEPRRQADASDPPEGFNPYDKAGKRR